MGRDREREKERERKESTIHWFTLQMPSRQRCKNPKPGARNLWVFHIGSGTQGLETSSDTLLGHM